ncbi:amphi-Trp domain-containing protein [Streptomyces antimicrobicus]|uniref:Amphi-Trp domain-containing protein n=1 Tax=Streptomyces antimicrobicus TaxID=2883108 RepID=A0ABS8B477_9ACTN|nr:amphi-Trp domain-containing protein [Streptomyces antimicrobicus]MCB5179419.1 amphi-Trp domain-containing protein [Streptomyces antimicrobicus]
MSDLKFEQKRSLSRAEAADLLKSLAQALGEGGKAEVDLGAGVLNLRVPDELRSEVEIEVSGDEIELEIELKWSIGRPGKAAAPARDTADGPEQAPTRTARPTRTRKATATTGAGRSTAKRG